MSEQTSCLNRQALCVNRHNALFYGHFENNFLDCTTLDKSFVQIQNSYFHSELCKFRTTVEYLKVAR